MIDFNKLADLIQKTLPNTNVSYSEYYRIIDVNVKDVKFNLSSNSILDAELAEEADKIIEKLEKGYKRWFINNKNLLFDIYFEDNMTAKIYLPRIIMNKTAVLQMLRSISCNI